MTNTTINTSAVLLAKVTFSNDNWNSFCKRLSDLSKIGDVIKLKLTPSEIFCYSVATSLGNTNKHINAFKGANLNIDEYCTDVNIPDKGIDFIIVNSKSFVKQAAFFIEDKSSVEFTLHYNTNNKNAKLLYLNNDVLNISFVGGNNISIKDISYQEMLAKTDTDLAEYNLIIDSDKLNRVKKLAAATSSESIAMWAEKGKMYFGELRWKLDVAECDTDQDRVQFNKKYLNSFEPALSISIDVFETFISANQNNTCLLIGLELDDL